MGTVEDKTSANTLKWLELIKSTDWQSEKEFAEQFVEICEWIRTCNQYGYKNTETVKLYGELPAPDTQIFPFENEIMQWMCNYVCISVK